MRYLRRRKNIVFSIFKKLKEYVENQSGYTIKAMRLDRGREYMSKAFEVFYEHHVIWLYLTASYSPQQNDVAERKPFLIW